MLPELGFWKTDLCFDDIQLFDDVTGLLGDTSRFFLDDEGIPVTSGLTALHRSVENYSVADTYARGLFQDARGGNVCDRQGASTKWSCPRVCP